MSKKFSQRLQAAWYEDSTWLLLLLPLSWLVALIARLRLMIFRLKAQQPPVPVLVVGNVTVGGTGKTPLVVSLCEYFQRHNIRVAVVSRGYGANPPHSPFHVHFESNVEQAGDEPLLIARRTGVPVIIDSHRQRALEYAVEHCQAEVVISDDGLQHYALPRTAEIVVLDGARLFGNKRCFPAGPLREPLRRIKEVDWCVINGRPEGTMIDAIAMGLFVADPVNLKSGKSLPIEDFVARFPCVKAVAGIGNPQRFFNSLMAQGLVVEQHEFPDHYRFTAADFADLGESVVVMTEKDAVKCRDIVAENAWYFPVSAQLPAVFFDAVYEKLMRG